MFLHTLNRMMIDFHWFHQVTNHYWPKITIPYRYHTPQWEVADPRHSTIKKFWTFFQPVVGPRANIKKASESVCDLFITFRTAVHNMRFFLIPHNLRKRFLSSHPVLISSFLSLHITLFSPSYPATLPLPLPSRSWAGPSASYLVILGSLRHLKT